MLLLFFKNNWMPKSNRSLSTTKLGCVIYYITFECFPSWFWMTERTLFCYRCQWPNQYVSQKHDSLYWNKRVFRPGVANWEWSYIRVKHSIAPLKAQLWCFINHQFHYKALHGKVSIYYVEKRHRMLILWAGPFLVMVILWKKMVKVY